MQRNTGYFPTESLEPSGNRLFSRSALNEGDLFRGSLTPLARTDLEEIYQYISICLDAPQAADRLMTAFEKSFEQLQNHPFSFPRADDESLRKKGYRKLIVENYVGAYLLNEQTKEVVVMRFFYGARDYKRLL